MSEIKLTKRYPHSRSEDITDAYTRGFEDGMKMGRGECRVYLDGNENYKAYRCDACGMQAVRWGDYCPSCGRRVVEVSE